MTSRSEQYPLLYFLLDEQAAALFSQHAVDEGRGLAVLLLQELAFLRLPCRSSAGGCSFIERIFLTYVDNNSNNTITSAPSDVKCSSENEIRYLLREEEVSHLHSLVSSRLPLYCMLGKVYDRVFQSIALRLAKKLPVHNHSLPFLRHMVIDPSSSFDYGSFSAASSSAASKLELITIMGGPHSNYFYRYLQSRGVAADITAYRCWVDVRSTLLKLDKLRLTAGVPLSSENSSGAAESAVASLDTFKLLLLDMRQLKAKVFESGAAPGSQRRERQSSAVRAACSGVTDSLRLEFNALVAASSSIRLSDIEGVEATFAHATGSKMERLLRVLERCIFEHFLENAKPPFLQSREYLLLLAHMHADRSADVQDFLAFSNFLSAIRYDKKLLRLRDSGVVGLVEQLLLLAADTYGGHSCSSESITGSGVGDAEPSWPRVASFITGKIFLSFEQQPQQPQPPGDEAQAAPPPRVPAAAEARALYLPVVKRQRRAPQSIALPPPAPKAKTSLSRALKTMVGGVTLPSLSLAIGPLSLKGPPAAPAAKAAPLLSTPRGSKAAQELLSNSSPVLGGSSMRSPPGARAAPHVIALHASIDHFRNITAENISSLSSVWVRHLSDATVGASSPADARGRRVLQQLLLLNGLFDDDILSYDSGCGSRSGKLSSESAYDNITKVMLLPREVSTELLFDYYDSACVAEAAAGRRSASLLVHISSTRTRGGRLCLGVSVASTSLLLALGRRVSGLCCAPSDAPAEESSFCSCDPLEGALLSLCTAYQAWVEQLPPAAETIYDLYGAALGGPSRSSLLQGPCDFSLLQCVSSASLRLLVYVCMLAATDHSVLLLSRSTSLLAEVLLAVARLSRPFDVDASAMRSLNSLETAELWWSGRINGVGSVARRAQLAGMHSEVFSLCSISTWMQQQQALLGTPRGSANPNPAPAAAALAMRRSSGASADCVAATGDKALVVVDVDSCLVLFGENSGGARVTLASVSSSDVAAMNSPAMGRLSATISSLLQEQALDAGSARLTGVSADGRANSAVEGAFLSYLAETALRLLPLHTLHYGEQGVIALDAAAVLRDSAAACGVEELFLAEMMESSCFLDLLIRQGKAIAAS